jgi:hypothetical protein
MRFPLLAVSLLGACSSGDGGTLPPPPPPPPPAPATIVVSSPWSEFEFDDGPRGSETVQFSAEVKDADGDPIAGAPVTWTVTSPLATIGTTGLLTLRDTAVGSGSIQVTATSGAITKSRSLRLHDWSLSRSVDNVNLETTIQASLSSGPNSFNSISLHVRCRGDDLELYVLGSEITANGTVEYRFSGDAALVRTWSESTNFRALFIPDAALPAFVDALASRDTLHFRYNKFGGGGIQGLFILRHAARATDKVEAACA